MTSFTAYNRGFRSRVMKGEKRKKGLTRGWRNQVPGTEWMEWGKKVSSPSASASRLVVGGEARRAEGPWMWRRGGIANGTEWR